MLGENKKILLIDDDLDLSGVIVPRLEANGYQVIAVANGKEGLSQLRLSLPDLIILDVLMPVMDGFAFYKELKKNLQTSHIPVIVLTARSKMEDTFSAVGADAFLVKPFEATTLLAKIAELIRYSGKITSPAPEPQKKLALEKPPWLSDAGLYIAVVFFFFGSGWRGGDALSDERNRQNALIGNGFRLTRVFRERFLNRGTLTE